ncbi:ABC transporter ATP-binding protein [Clostridium sp.]|uniref:ABC transporter ATP-binding protein n=1 Tax=Clostridium sp. TaxID=1506 RepID=UPI00261F7DFD|nr:ABC transporter ATP-binding protein [Clostridium sp.]
MERAIEIRNLCKNYKVYDSNVSKIRNILNPFSKKNIDEFKALSDVSFYVNKGEILGIIGNNGAGKSTLLKILTGVSYASSGEVKVNGRVSSLLELGTGFNPELTGEENIFFNGSLMGLTKEEVERVKDEIIDFADIGEFISQPVKNYSSGMYARLAFAVAININPDILIVDEILSVGDISFQKKCVDKFNEFKESGKTVIYVSHGLETVKEFCERVVWLDNGRVKEIGTAFDIVENYYENLMNSTSNEEEKIEKSKFVEINEVNILNKKEFYLKGDSIEFKINYNVFKTSVRNAGITIEIRKAYKEPTKFRSTDQFIFSVNSNVDGVTIPWELGENEIEFKIESLDVRRGIYYLDIIFSESQNLVSLESKENLVSFEVKNEDEEEGFIFLNSRWHEEF